MKRNTNGEVDIQIGKEDTKRVHMYTANAGPYAKAAALHTERLRLFKIKKKQSAAKDNGSKDIHGYHVISIIVLVKRCNIKFLRLSY